MKVLLFWCIQVGEQVASEVMALVESALGVVGTYEDEAQVRVFETGVDVQHEFFGAARDTHWGPGLALPHGVH